MLEFILDFNLLLPPIELLLLASSLDVLIV